MVWQKEDKFSYETFIGKHKTLCVFFILLFVCLSARLFYLQIVKGGRYREISERQRMHNTRERERFSGAGYVLFILLQRAVREFILRPSPALINGYKC